VREGLPFLGVLPIPDPFASCSCRDPQCGHEFVGHGTVPMALWRYGPETPSIRFEEWNLRREDMETKFSEDVARLLGTACASADSGENHEDVRVVARSDDQFKRWAKPIEVLQGWLNRDEDR